MVAPARFLRHAQTLVARGSSASGCAAAGSAAATADAAAAPAATHARQAGAMPVTRSFSGAATALSALRAAGGGGGSSSCSCSGSSIFSTGGSSGPRGNWSSRASSTHASRSAASYAGSSGQPHSSGSSSDDRSGSSSSSSSSGRDTPKAQGFRMPGEWEPHAGTWMAFPHDPHLWRAAARPAQQQLAAVARAVAQFEQVWMLVDPKVRAEARAAFRGMSGVELVEAPTNDVWTRDWGPTCLVRDVPSGSSSGTGGSSSGGGRRRREVGALHFDYNCYGAPLKEHPLMPDWSLDRAAGRALPARHPDVVRREHVWRAPPGLHLEGGAVLADGEGTLLVTEECLLHPSRDLPPPAWRRRHPHPLDSLALGRPTDAPAAAAVAAVAAAVAAAEVTGGGGGAPDEAGLGRRVERESRKAAVGEMLCEWLGADKVLWLPHGMAGDEEGTNGHVDNVAAFAAPGVVLLASCNSPDQDPDQTRLAAENMAALADQTDARGRKLRVVPVPCPLPVLKVTREEAGGAATVAAAAAAGYGGRMAVGARLPASYINHYIVNGGVVVPLFGGEQRRSDDAALEVLTAVYGGGGGGGGGGRRVVGVDSREVLLGGGNVHCITQQLPAAGG